MRLILHPRFFVWVIVPVMLAGVYLTYGLPHPIWSYSWRDEGRGFDPLAKRFYTSCTYVGPYGNFTERHPKDGNCHWFVMRKRS